ncbi:MAG: tetratricopeptide repeat protein [Chloroflexi bacterium]|nr:tetratricopeptide repeat protein [Chloroflexota bacterium]
MTTPPTATRLLQNRWIRIGLAALAAAVLFTGALNVRSAFQDDVADDWAIDPEAPSAIDGLIGRDAAARGGTPLGDLILGLQDALREDPDNGAAATQLGLAYLQQTRETGDPSYYPKAETLFTQALEEDDADFAAMVGMGSLALARHDFAAALTWGEQAHAVNPSHAPALGVIGDAQIELGRYDEAVVTFQAMVDLRPDLASYSRVSYARELFGDRPGAIIAMEQAAEAGAGRAENIAWTQVQLGNLHAGGGDLATATRAYETALRTLPGYVYALAGQGRVAAAQGDYSTAIAHYEAALTAMPLPEFAIALGDVYTAAGDAAAAERTYALVEAIQALSVANGVDLDLELALFTVDHPERGQDPATTLALAEAAYARRPGIHAADVLAWARFAAGDLNGAWSASVEARRLGTKDALMAYHAGVIAGARGDTAAAQELLQTALTLDPHFSLRYAPDAQSRLTRLDAELG